MSEAKRACGRKAVEFVEEGMVVGLGTGSTAQHFIDGLIERVKGGLDVTCVATSERSRVRAEHGGVRVVGMDEVERIDLTVDGADEIDPRKRMIKGGGGAALREKIVAASSKEMVVIVDESKCVEALGAFPLPLEVTPFGYLMVERRLAGEGFEGSFRRSDGGLFITDEGHYVFDLALGGAIEDPEGLDRYLKGIPGVLDTGFFFGLAGRVVVGKADGSVECR